LLRRKAIGYGVTGAVLLDTPVGERRVAVKGAGEVPLGALVK
jgi:hypothetical protein